MPYKQVDNCNDDNKTFITVTEKGQERCLEKLDQLLELNEYLYSDASLKDRYSEEEQRLDENRMSKGLKIKPSHPTKSYGYSYNYKYNNSCYTYTFCRYLQ